MRFFVATALFGLALAGGQAGGSQQPPTYTDSAPPSTAAAGTYPASSAPAGTYPASSAPAGTYPASSAPAGTYPVSSAPAASGYPTMKPSTHPAGNYSHGASTSTYVATVTGGSGPSTQTSLVVVSASGAPAPSSAPSGTPQQGMGASFQAPAALAIAGGFLAFML